MSSHDEKSSKKSRSRRSRKRRKRDKSQGQKRDHWSRASHILKELRELTHSLARERGVTRRDAGDAIGELSIPLSVDTDVPPGNGVERDEVEDFLADLRRVVHETLRGAAAFLHGRVYCFLCDSPDCRHSAPQNSDQVFVGYSPTGCPQWQGFVNLLIDQQSEMVDKVYGERPEIISVAVQGSSLKAGLMPGFGREDLAFNVLGQVVTGLVPVDLSPRSSAERVALTIQLVETRTGRARRRFRVNLIGLSLDEILEAAAEGARRGPAERLRRVLRSTQHKLNKLGRNVAQAERRGDQIDVTQRSGSLLNALRGDIDRIFRPVHRRTQHAQDRHLGGNRPTSDAMKDVESATSEQQLWDTRRDTVIVIGRRSRAHVFTLAGRHVTSLRLESGELERKLERRRWEPLGEERSRQFMESVGEA